MRLEWGQWGCFWLFGAVCLCVSSSLGEVSPKSSVNSIDDDHEIPAVPYITLALIRDSAVHKELDLTPGQVVAVQDAVAQVDEAFWKLRDVAVSDSGAHLERLRTQLRDQLRKDLVPRQLERFDQLVLQRRSWHALVSTDVAKQLGLSGEQLVKLRAAIKQTAKDHESLEKKINDQSARLQGEARRKQRIVDTQRFDEVLTANQRENYSRQLGTGFDFSLLTPVGCIAPELRAVDAWINTEPVSLEQLRGKVVVLHFWAFECINCIRNLPHYQRWSVDFKPSQVTVLGVHTPETNQERFLDNLRQNIKDRKIEYPVVFDANAENWKAWGNSVWPSVYLIDKRGRVRYWWYGELNWNGAHGEELFRQRIKQLVDER